MGDRETSRTITGKSTIPEGTAATGTATTNAGDNTIIDISGGVYADFAKFTENGYRNIYLYFLTEHKVARLKSILKISNTVFKCYMDRAVPSVSSSAFTVIIADLIEFAVKNNTSTVGEFDGQVLNGNSSVNGKVLHDPGNGIPVQKDAKTVDGSSTSIVISETR